MILFAAIIVLVIFLIVGIKKSTDLAKFNKEEKMAFNIMQRARNKDGYVMRVIRNRQRLR